MLVIFEMLKVRDFDKLQIPPLQFLVLVEILAEITKKRIKFKYETKKETARHRQWTTMDNDGQRWTTMDKDDAKVQKSM